MKPYILSGVPACEILKISPREYPSERRIHPNTPKKSDCDSRSPNPHATIGSDAENAWRHADRRRCFRIFARPWLLDGAAWIDCAFSRFASRASLAAQKRSAHLAQMVEARLNFDGELRRRKFGLPGLRSGALRNRPDPAGIAPVSYRHKKISPETFNTLPYSSTPDLARRQVSVFFQSRRQMALAGETETSSNFSDRHIGFPQTPLRFV